LACLLLGLAAQEREARAAVPEDLRDACVDAYERGQEQRLAGALLDARVRFASCAADACPAFIHEDCARLMAEVNSEVPSVSFEVTSGGRPIVAVRVSEEDRVLAERVDQTPVEFDPGSHWLRFETPGAEPVTQMLVLGRHDKNRRIRVEFPILAPAPPGRRDPAAPATGAVNPVPWVVLGVGALGVSGFALFASAGSSKEAELERTCAPSCGANEVQSARTNYVLADVSLAVGVTGFLLGGYLLLTPDSKPATSGAFPMVVRLGPGGGTAAVRGDF
jgi:hypothetical protein